MLSGRVFVILAVCSAARGQNSSAVDFARDIQPLLTETCMGCHSGSEAQAGLQVHTRDELMKGGKSGPGVVPGDGAGSLLELKMQGQKGVRMPPSGPPVSPEVIARIRKWIDEG